MPRRKTRLLKRQSRDVARHLGVSGRATDRAVRSAICKRTSYRELQQEAKAQGISATGTLPELYWRVRVPKSETDAVSTLTAREIRRRFGVKGSADTVRRLARREVQRITKRKERPPVPDDVERGGPIVGGGADNITPDDEFDLPGGKLRGHGVRALGDSPESAAMAMFEKLRAPGLAGKTPTAAWAEHDGQKTEIPYSVWLRGPDGVASYLRRRGVIGRVMLRVLRMFGIDT